MPGYGLTLIDDSQMDNVDFKGDDRFDTPQTGILVSLTEQDKSTTFDTEGHTYEFLIGKRISWAKYADADATFFDNDLGKDVVFIQLDKLRGYEDIK